MALLSDLSGTLGFREASFEHDSDIGASFTDHPGIGGDLDIEIDKFMQELQMPISTPH